MPTETDIANRALAQAGTRSKIASLTEQSKEAEVARLLFESTRDLVFQTAPWDFARAAASLPLRKAKPGTPENTSTPTTVWNDTTQPMPPWAYEYGVPVDCLFMRWILPQFGEAGSQGSPMRFVKSSALGASPYPPGSRVMTILTNAPKAIGIYTARIVDPNMWPPLFQDAVVLALAARMSIPLSGDKGLAQGDLQAAMLAVLMARVTDGNENFGQQIDILPDWIRARNSLPGPYEPPEPLAFVNLSQLN